MEEVREMIRQSNENPKKKLRLIKVLSSKHKQTQVLKQMEGDLIVSKGQQSPLLVADQGPVLDFDIEKFFTDPDAETANRWTRVCGVQTGKESYAKFSDGIADWS